jgi:hypothetical protein
MRNAETILSIIRERGRRKLPLENIYRQLYNRDLYLRAYSADATSERRIRSNNESWLICNPILCARRIPGLPPSAMPSAVNSSSRRMVLWSYGAANSGRRSQKIRRPHSGFKQKNLRTERISLTATPSHRRSVNCRLYRLCTLADCRPQDGQVDFLGLLLTTSWTSLG